MAAQGDLLAGRYRVRGEIGRGGMGVVWRARDETLGRDVAVKELRTFSDASAAELDALRERMRREARAAARIRHPGVVVVHDVTEHDGRPIIVMDLVDGPSLDDVLQEQNVIAPVQAAAIGAEVLDALGAAHAAGVLHRDVKPANVLLDRSGRVVLTDFGIAAVDDAGTARLTRSGELVGSLDYLAPERAQGREFGPPSDVWSLGATLYAAVEGSSPFRRDSTWSTLNAIVVERLPEPARAGPLTPVLRALLDKDAAARPDARRARDLLREVAAGQQAVVPPGAGAGIGTDSVPPTSGEPAPLSATPPPGAVGPTGPLPVDRPVAPTGHTPVPGPPPAPPRRHGAGTVAAIAAAAVLVLGGSAAAAWFLTRDDPGATGRRARASHSAEARPTGRHGSSKAPVVGPSRSTSADGGNKACRPHGKGGGKVDCTTWRNAKSYDASGGEVGYLHAGTNYFYCQQDLRRRVTYGKWTNTWWAKTDDDNGNTGVWVSDVYLQGGSNDSPVPGLPECGTE